MIMARATHTQRALGCAARPAWAGLVAWLLVLAAVVVAPGCAVQFVSAYDEKTDVAVTDLHRTMEGMFIKLDRQLRDEPEKTTYAAYKDTYDDIRLDLATIKLRAESIAKNSITVQQLDLLQDSFDSL